MMAYLSELRKATQTAVASGQGREFELLLSCARAELSSEHIERIRQFIGEKIEWNTFLEFATIHRIFPLMSNALLTAAPDLLPPSVREHLIGTQKKTATFNAFMANELAQLSDLFCESGLSVMSLKGATLALIAYGNLNLRESVDIDLWIRKDDFVKAKEVLIEKGYVPQIDFTRLKKLRERIYMWQTRQFPLRRGARTFNVDLHISLMPPLYDFDIEFDLLWKRSQIVALSQGSIHSCEPEDLILILCFHGVKNRWETLKYACDIAELIRSNPKLDWDEILRRARAYRCLRILLMGICLAHLSLDVTLPNSVLAEIENDTTVVDLVGEIFMRLPASLPGNRFSLAKRIHFHISLLDNLATKTRYTCMALVRRFAELTY